jgi:dihydrofolate reductase
MPGSDAGNPSRRATSAVFSAKDRGGVGAGEDVAIAGGAQTVQQFLSAGLIDELRLHIAPILLGAGERPLDGVGNLTLEPTEVRGTSLVTHVHYRVMH